MKEISVENNISIKTALKKLDKTAEKTLLIVDRGNALIGTLSDGDVRRALLSEKDLDDGILDIYNPKPIVIFRHEQSTADVQQIFLEKRIRLIPIVNENMKVLDYLTWDQVFANKTKEYPRRAQKVDIPVVIMAGGKGKRMAPFTDILPKPLIPINGRSVLEEIIESFKQSGIKRYLFTLNYKGEMIEAYFNSIEKDYTVEYIREPSFLGTAGSLRLIEELDTAEDFIVSNCDIIVKADYYDVYKFHSDSRADLTIISSIQHHTVPYGVIEYKNGGQITNIDEKPEFSFVINTGVYVLKNTCIDYIPDNGAYDMPQLIERLIADRKKVLTYPVNENDYIDIGQWDEYRSAIKRMET